MRQDGRTAGGAQDRRAWVLLIHQLPSEPAYVRVRTSRRLRGLGAVVLKNSVYVLPEGDAAREDFQWVRREILDAGGEAMLVAARFVEGVSDSELEEVFSAERNAEYAEVVSTVAAMEAGTESDVARLRRRMERIGERDHFGASGRFAAEQSVSELERRVRGEAEEEQMEVVDKPEGAMWVTREGARVDRVASAWLIRRFIDPAARFRFVVPEGYAPEEGELRFDMYEGEFTHEGGRCTFETLLHRFGVRARGLSAIAEIVHDIDCKDDRYGRPETAGVASLVRGIVAAHVRDEDRIAAAVPVFDALLAGFESVS